jgi:hypothetical protein
VSTGNDLTEAQRNSANWRSLLDDAENGAEVVDVCRRFVQCWTPQQLAALPEGAVPPEFTHHEEVVVYALNLAHAQMREMRRTAELDSMAEFFALASRRLAKLLAAPAGSRVPLFVKGLL